MRRCVFSKCQKLAWKLSWDGAYYNIQKRVMMQDISLHQQDLKQKQTTRKSVKRETAEPWNFGCLRTAAQIWVKQVEPAKSDGSHTHVYTLHIKQMKRCEGLFYKHASLAWLRSSGDMKTKAGQKHLRRRVGGALCSECTLAAADVHCGPGLQEMYRPDHMEVEGRRRDSSLFPQAHKEPIHQDGTMSGA